MVGERPDREGLAGGNPHRRRINSGRRLLDAPRKPQVNHAAIRNPVVGERTRDDEQKNNCRSQQSQTNPRCPKTMAYSNSQEGSPFRRDTEMRDAGRA